jgi:hypothetical protein
VAFAHHPALLSSALTSADVGAAVNDKPEDGDDDMDEEEKVIRARWLASGGKDGRIAIWPLMAFGGESSRS